MLDTMTTIEIDERIAVDIFGWHRIGGNSNVSMLVPPDGDKRINWAAEWDEEGRPNWLPKYTLYYSDAFEVLEQFESFKVGKSKSGGYYATVGNTTYVAETLPIAICCAALIEKDKKP